MGNVPATNVSINKGIILSAIFSANSDSLFLIKLSILFSAALALELNICREEW